MNPIETQSRSIAMSTAEVVIKTAVDFGKSVITGRYPEQQEKPVPHPVFILTESQQLESVRAELRDLTPMQEIVPVAPTTAPAQG